MELSITIPRATLIKTLEEKRATLVTAWDAEIDRFTQKRNTVPVTTQALADWYVEIATMLGAGEIKVNSRGEFKSTDEDITVPDKPTVNSTRNRKKDIEYDIENAKSSRDRQLAALDTSIRLLNLATNDNVEVAASQYEQLLSQDVVGRRYY